MAVEESRVVERLSLEAASGHTLPAIEHRRRYELASELCAGLRVMDLCCGSGYGCRILRQRAAAVTGVDVDVATIDLASATVGDQTDIEFSAADAVEYLGEDLKDRFDAIVMFEGLEHLVAPETALERMLGHAEKGMRLVVSVPNSRAFNEDNPFHVTDYGFEEFLEAFGRFPKFVPLYQFVAEGSLIRGDEAEERDVRIDNEADAPYANNFIACVGFDAARIAGVSARAVFTLAPAHNRYMRNLERANAELRRANARLSRKLIGTADSAAATLVAKLKRTESELAAVRKQLAERERAEAQQRELHAWIDHLHEEIDRRAREVDRHAREVEAMQSTRVWRLAGRYWRLRDRLLRRGSH
jgi:SAM-dependent methyltransferase